MGVLCMGRHVASLTEVSVDKDFQGRRACAKKPVLHVGEPFILSICSHKTQGFVGRLTDLSRTDPSQPSSSRLSTCHDHSLLIVTAPGPLHALTVPFLSSPRSSVVNTARSRCSSNNRVLKITVSGSPLVFRSSMTLWSIAAAVAPGGGHTEAISNVHRSAVKFATKTLKTST